TTRRCLRWSYSALAIVSNGYSDEMGRLLTCYSPVRRSCTPEGALPLDLHVLSTPPAFVLSQDQTLQQKPGKTSRTGPRQKIKLAQNQSMNKLDTLLSSQETPAHHFGPRGPGRGNFHTVRGPARGVKRSARPTPVQPSTVVPGPSGAAAVTRGLTLGRRSVP